MELPEWLNRFVEKGELPTFWAEPESIYVERDAGVLKVVVQWTSDYKSKFTLKPGDAAVMLKALATEASVTVK